VATTTENITFQDTALTDDALDRRAALAEAVAYTGSKRFEDVCDVIKTADIFYRWLRARNTLRISLQITAGPVTVQEPHQGEE
jgi:hypothetical protein